MQEKSVEEDEINLFNPTILDRLPISYVAGLLIRPLKSTDYDKGMSYVKTMEIERDRVRIICYNYFFF